MSDDPNIIWGASPAAVVALAATGANGVLLGAVGAALVVLGFVVVRLARRRARAVPAGTAVPGRSPEASARLDPALDAC